MRYLDISRSSGRDVLRKTIAQMLEHLQSGRLEACAVFYTLKDHGHRETFITYFAPSAWRLTMARILVAGAGQLLGGTATLMKMAPEVADMDPTHMQPPSTLQ